MIRQLAIKQSVMMLGMMICVLGSQAQAGFWQFLGMDNSTKTTDVQQADSRHDDKQEHHAIVTEREVGSKQDFDHWRSNNPALGFQVDEYEIYLHHHLGAIVPPIHELLTTARSWQQCGFEPYEVPPKSLWANIIPTLTVYHVLKQRAILPDNTPIRSVYRNPELNRCAGGAAVSKHLVNGAIDIWIADHEDASQEVYAIKDALCQFWTTEGKQYNLGLGLYATGAIHLDTQGYRKWGTQFSSQHSPCREAVLDVKNRVYPY